MRKRWLLFAVALLASFGLVTASATTAFATVSSVMPASGEIVADDSIPEEPATGEAGGEESRSLENDVEAAVAHVTLTSLPGTAEFGDQVTLSAVIAGTEPTGTVTFFSGENNLGTAPVGVDGFATLTVSSLQIGTHTITAVYSGDDHHDPSTSTAASITVTTVSTGISLVGAPNPAVLGSIVTLTAVVSGASPAGVVEFYSGTALQGVVEVMEDGSATFMLATLALGEHSITAVYLGDEYHSPATSAALAVTITATPNPPDIDIPEPPVIPEPPTTPEPPTSDDTTSESDSNSSGDGELARTGIDGAPTIAGAGVLLLVVGAILLVARIRSSQKNRLR